LLHSPPGTSKTTLCQGLAQRIPNNLTIEHDQIQLLEINAVLLLGKKSSQVAKTVETFFSDIKRCARDLTTFTFILIDQVENIANSRERISDVGEAQDSIRATHALLVGLDATKIYPNVMYLCTSSLVEAVDPTFRSRFTFEIFVEPSGRRESYTILRTSLDKLSEQGVLRWWVHYQDTKSQKRTSWRRLRDMEARFWT
jgi:AAA+ superfamily predicted ATPase